MEGSKPQITPLADLFSRIEATTLARFHTAGFGQHAGDKGANREHILREFLAAHLPKKFGLTKGEIITMDGSRSHSADIIIYDAINSPVLYREETAILPIEGVYGIIEVKSALSKAEFVDAASKIAAFKKLAPRDLAVIETREYVTLSRPSRPFGIVFGYTLSGNSLDSLRANLLEQNASTYDVNYFVNLVTVLNQGLLWMEQVNLTQGSKEMLLDTDKIVQLVLTAKKRAQNNEPGDEILMRAVPEAAGDKTFGRFYVYLLIMLLRMKLNPPDLARYLDPTIGHTVIRES